MRKIDITFVKLAAKGCCKTSYRVRHAVHSRVDHIIIFDHKRNLRIAVTLK